MVAFKNALNFYNLMKYLHYYNNQDFFSVKNLKLRIQKEKIISIKNNSESIIIFKSRPSIVFKLLKKKEVNLTENDLIFLRRYDNLSRIT